MYAYEIIGDVGVMLFIFDPYGQAVIDVSSGPMVAYWRRTLRACLCEESR